MLRANMLQGPEYPTRSGTPANVVLLLHGLGADGNDLIELAPHLAEALPNTHFIAPNAPFPCDMASFGLQWFSLQNRSEEALQKAVTAVAPILEKYIEDVADRFLLKIENIALVGFSQGAMLAMHVGLRLPNTLACILAYSGALIAPKSLNAEKRSAPPVCLVHGEADQVVPFFAFSEALHALQEAKVSVEAYSSAELGHGIDPAGLSIGRAFLAKYLS